MAEEKVRLYANNYLVVKCRAPVHLSMFVCMSSHSSIPRLTSKERRHSVIKANCPGKQGEVTLRRFRETMTEMPREAFHPPLDYLNGQK